MFGVGASSGLATRAGAEEHERADADSGVDAGLRFVPVRDAHWAYRDKGAGRPALFLHPFLLNSAFWIDQLNDLADVRRCIAPDMRGWGRSEPVSDTRLDLGTYARDVLTFLDQIGVTEPVDVVGMSVSSFISGLVYELAPERIASLTLISSVFDFERNLPYERYQREMARTVVVEGHDALFRRFDEYIDGPNSSLHMRARYKQMLLDSRVEMIVAHLTGSGTTPARPDLPGKIKVPVLIPAGTEDSVISMEQFEQNARAFPNATVVAIEGAGRLIPLEASSRFSAALRRFWA